MLIPLTDGEQIRFGEDREFGVVQSGDGGVEIVEVASVGEEKILVHDSHVDNPGLAFALSHLSTGVTTPTPIGVFRDVVRDEYGDQMNQQLAQAQAKRGAGDLATLFRTLPSWEIE